MIHMCSDHRCVMATFVINARKERVATRDADNNRQRMTAMGNIRARIGKEDGDKEAFTFEERYQELEEEIQHEAAAAKIQSENTKMEVPQRRRKLKQKKKWKRKQ